MCQAKLSGASIGSTEIEFIPGKLRGGHYVADTRTAGLVIGTAAENLMTGLIV